jgi:hypothetical protein
MFSGTWGWTCDYARPDTDRWWDDRHAQHVQVGEDAAPGGLSTQLISHAGRDTSEHPPRQGIEVT